MMSNSLSTAAIHALKTPFTHQARRQQVPFFVANLMITVTLNVLLQTLILVRIIPDLKAWYLTMLTSLVISFAMIAVALTYIQPYLSELNTKKDGDHAEDERHQALIREHLGKKLADENSTGSYTIRVPYYSVKNGKFQDLVIKVTKTAENNNEKDEKQTKRTYTYTTELTDSKDKLSWKPSSTAAFAAVSCLSSGVITFVILDQVQYQPLHAYIIYLAILAGMADIYNTYMGASSAVIETFSDYRLSTDDKGHNNNSQEADITSSEADPKPNTASRIPMAALVLASCIGLTRIILSYQTSATLSSSMMGSISLTVAISLVQFITWTTLLSQHLKGKFEDEPKLDKNTQRGCNLAGTVAALGVSVGGYWGIQSTMACVPQIGSATQSILSVVLTLVLCTIPCAYVYSHSIAGMVQATRKDTNETSDSEYTLTKQEKPTPQEDKTTEAKASEGDEIGESGDNNLIAAIAKLSPEDEHSSTRGSSLRRSSIGSQGA